MSETTDNLTSSEVHRRLSSLALKVRRLSERAAEAFIAEDLVACQEFLDECQKEVTAMYQLARAHKHLLRRPDA